MRHLYTKLRTLLMTLCLAFPAMQTHAALITHNNYTLDTQANIVTGGGLEWLQWDETLGESWNSASAIYNSLGWSVATNQQMADLFTDFFPELNFGTDDNEQTGSRAIGAGLIFLNPIIVGNFLELFGIGFGTLGDTIDRFGSQTIFGDDPDNDGNIRYANVNTVLDLSIPDFLHPTDAWFIRDVWTKNSFNPNYGVALVRSAQVINPPINTVSAPATFALLALSLIALGLRKRIKSR